MFDYNKIVRNIYIDEIEQFKEFLAGGIYSSFSNECNEKIISLENDFVNKNNALPIIDQEFNYQELQYLKSLKTLSIYRLLSSLYVELFSIWELQVRDYGNGVKKYYNKRMEEYAQLVNTLKHGKASLPNKTESSFDKLKAINSKYLQSSQEFFNIIPGIHGGEILNISLQDLLSLCDEIIGIWSNLE